ncbi:hypothetical protein INT44_002912 [Umbelopsis vinacea]|uniref:RanBD1 domain-containing protein n=1 Tax=Umbelopsis vinacea TaxID=44442 RepID=A0A8H7Q6H4_9FUNG|nr:hypothetical protein INT44_002912 [Umbelopsis vinacea]
MSSPPDTTGLDDAATRKRERATSVDPAPAERNDDDEPMQKNEDVSKAPVKKTKHDADTTVRAIRKNLKDMKTTDMTWATGEHVEHMQALDEQNETEDVHMSSYNDKKRGPDEVYAQSNNNTTDVEQDSSNTAADAAPVIPPSSPRKKPTRRDTPDLAALQEPTASEDVTENESSQESEASSTKKGGLFAQFAGKSSQSNGDEWDEFAEESAPASQEKPKPQPKYAFGSSSGFGTKGWGAAHQTAPVPGGSLFGSTGKTGFSGFGSSTFGASNSVPSSQVSSSSTTPSFSSFASSTASPFALLAAKGSSSNALSSLPQRSTSVEKDQTKAVKSDDDSDADESGDDNDETESTDDRGISPQTFGSEQKVKLPGLKRSEITTGEEDEYTVHTIKAKLLVMDGSSDSWKERGTGTLRINTKKTHGNSATRLVMRADSVFRVILNVPLFVGMKVWIMQEKFVRFAAFETVESVEGGEKKDDAAASGSTKLVNYALKVGSTSSAQDLYDMIIAHLPRSE